MLFQYSIEPSKLSSHYGMTKLFHWWWECYFYDLIREIYCIKINLTNNYIDKHPTRMIRECDRHEGSATTDGILIWSHDASVWCSRRNLLFRLFLDSSADAGLNNFHLYYNSEYFFQVFSSSIHQRAALGAEKHTFRSTMPLKWILNQFNPCYSPIRPERYIFSMDQSNKWSREIFSNSVAIWIIRSWLETMSYDKILLTFDGKLFQ